jgi:hypothetical protein
MVEVAFTIIALPPSLVCTVVPTFMGGVVPDR